MESIPKNRLLEFNPDQLQSIRKQYNFDKPGEMGQAIDNLEAWIKMQKHFTKKEMPRNYLEKAIIGSKGSIERVKSKLDKICTFRTAIPEYFGENLTKNNFEELPIFTSVILPKPTSDNCRVYILKVTGQTFTCEQLINCYRYVVLLCEYAMAFDYSDGYFIVIDYNDANLMELVKVLIQSDMRKIFTVITEGFGLRLKGIHIMTASKAADAFISIFKQLLSPKLGKRVCVHKDISTLYEYVPKDIFPVEYGGKERSFTQLRDEMKNELTGEEFKKYIEEMNSAKTDESYRETDKFNDTYMGMPGSFRTLNVD